MVHGTSRLIVCVRRPCSSQPLCSSRLPPISFSANLASLSIQLRNSQYFNPQWPFHVCSLFTSRTSNCSILLLLSQGFFSVFAFPNSEFPRSTPKHIYSTCRHLGLRRKYFDNENSPNCMQSPVSRFSRLLIPKIISIYQNLRWQI